MTKHKLRNRLTRFRLQTLLALVAVSSVAAAWFAWNIDQRQQEKPAIAEFEKQGGRVIYHSFYVDRSWLEKQGDKWLGNQVHTAMLRNSDAVDLTHFIKFKKLRIVGLSFSRVSDISPLAELVNIEVIFLGGTDVEDLSSLKNLAKLEMLELDSTPVKDLSPLHGLQNLREIYLRDTELTEHEVEELRNALPGCRVVYWQRKAAVAN